MIYEGTLIRKEYKVFIDIIKIHIEGSWKSNQILLGERIEKEKVREVEKSKISSLKENLENISITQNKSVFVEHEG